MQLATEDEVLSQKYDNKSIAEQNSLDIAWKILMKDEYADLRSTIFCTRSEMFRFRQVVVNIVLGTSRSDKDEKTSARRLYLQFRYAKTFFLLIISNPCYLFCFLPPTATDIFDKEMNDLRKRRWDSAFAADSSIIKKKKLSSKFTNLRATVIIEYIMQASDVCHTMQHWHIYRKFNERLFREMRAAFKAGRMGKDPAEFWYKGELGFFDNYIIPMADKLKTCGVFGVSSDEVLNYALNNRLEWELRGELVVAEMIENERMAEDCEVAATAAESATTLVAIKDDEWGTMRAPSLHSVEEEAVTNGNDRIHN